MKIETLRLPKINGKPYLRYERQIRKLYENIYGITLTDKGYILQFTIKTI